MEILQEQFLCRHWDTNPGTSVLHFPVKALPSLQELESLFQMDHLHPLVSITLVNIEEVTKTTSVAIGNITQSCSSHSKDCNCCNHLYCKGKKERRKNASYMFMFIFCSGAMRKVLTRKFLIRKVFKKIIGLEWS